MSEKSIMFKYLNTLKQDVRELFPPLRRTFCGFQFEFSPRKIAKILKLIYKVINSNFFEIN